MYYVSYGRKKNKQIVISSNNVFGLGRSFMNISLVGRVFANRPRDRGSIPGQVIPKTFKMVLDSALLNTQQYKVRIKGKLEQSKGRSSVLPYTSV